MSKTAENSLLDLCKQIREEESKQGKLIEENHVEDEAAEAEPLKNCELNSLSLHMSCSLKIMSLYGFLPLVFWVLQKFYKVYYNWLNSNYLICITIETTLFKTKHLPELC